MIPWLFLLAAAGAGLWAIDVAAARFGFGTRGKFRVGIDLRSAAGALLSGAAGGLAFPPADAWPFLLVSQTAFLLLLREKSPADARNLGLVFGLAHATSTMHWLTGVFGAHAVSLFALVAAYFGLLGHLVATTRGAAPYVRAAQVACFALAVEWLRGDAWAIRFPWYTVPHALAGTPLLAAPARFLGAYGLSLGVWFLLAACVFGRPRAAIAFAALPLLGLAVPEPSPADRRALVLQAEGPSEIEKLIARVPADSRAVDLVVLPEYSFFFSPELALGFPNGPNVLSERFGAPVVFGAVDGAYGTKTFRNVAVLLDETGRIAGRVQKRRPVPLMRDGLPGRESPTFPLPGGRLGIGICYDLDAPAVTSALVRNGATILALPTFDAMTWGALQHVQHERLARLRAIESGRWIVRAASSGRSESIDPLGRASRAGVEIGDTGWAIVPFAHRTGVPPSVPAAWLGPGAAALSLLLLLRRRRGR